MKKWAWSGLLWAVAATAGTVDFPATLQWSQRVELSPRVSGVVREISVSVGDHVKKGQTLLVLEAAPYQARVAESRANVMRFTDEAAEARRDLARTQELYDRTVISTTELDQAKLRLSRVKSQMDAAQAHLVQSRLDMADSVLRAPFDGVVVSRMAEPGQYVAVGLQAQPLLALAKAGEMMARFKVATDRIGSIKSGQSASVLVGQQEYPATLRPAMEPMTGKEGPAYEVNAMFTLKELLRAGMVVTVRVP